MLEAHLLESWQWANITQIEAEADLILMTFDERYRKARSVINLQDHFGSLYQGK